LITINQRIVFQKISYQFNFYLTLFQRKIKEKFRQNLHKQNLANSAFASHVINSLLLQQKLRQILALKYLSN